MSTRHTTDTLPKIDESDFTSDDQLIYKLELHGETTVGPFDVIRVPNGWIYHNDAVSTFVPFHAEFEKRDLLIPKVPVQHIITPEEERCRAIASTRGEKFCGEPTCSFCDDIPF